MFTTNLFLLLPVIGVAAGLLAAMLVVRRADARLASAGFGTKTAPVLVSLGIKEAAMTAMGGPLAVLLIGSSALMLKEYLTPPPPPIVREVIPYDPSKWGLPPLINPDGLTDPSRLTVPATPTGGGIPRPVEDSRAATDDAGTQSDWAAQANAGTIDPAALNRDSVELVRGGIPDKGGYVALEKYPELVRRVDPVYPRIALETGSEGRVMVQFLQDYDGSVLRAEVAKSSGNAALDEAAVEAVRQWKFTPAIAPGGAAAREIGRASCRERV